MVHPIAQCYLIPALILWVMCSGCDHDPDLHSATVNGKVNPIGLEPGNIRLGWAMKSRDGWTQQQAYQILAASRPEWLREGRADYWDSGKVIANRSQGVPYGGKTPEANERLFWKVRIWNEKGLPSEWSEIQVFSTGLYQPADWKARWISCRDHVVSEERSFFGSYAQTRAKNPGDTAAVYLRKSFSLDQIPERAMVFLSGLGYYELYLNGRRVGDHVMDPVFSDYQKSVYYQSYQIDSLLREGENSIGVILGNGFYNSPSQDLFMMDQAHWKTPPKLLFQLEVDQADESFRIVSDSTWLWNTGPIVWNSIRGGETIDMRYSEPAWHQADFEASDWEKVIEVAGPPGKLRSQQMPPMRVTRQFKPKRMWQSGDSAYVFDFGENLTGWASVRLDRCEEGRRIRLFFNEALLPDSSLDKKHSSGHTRGRFQEGRLICNGEPGAVFEPRFAYHGFRYLQVEGLHRPPGLSDVVAKKVHSDLDSRGRFHCSDTMLNHLQAAVRRTLLNAIHSMPGEEPTREKMGWTFDAGMVTMESYLYNYKAESAYRKYLQDLIDGQEPSGHIPPIVPTNGWGWLQPDQMEPVLYDDPWWGGTIFFVTQTLFEWTADTSLLVKAYEPMRSYLEFVGSTADDQLQVHWSLGDWLDMRQWSKGWGPGLTPVVQTSTACYFWMASGMARTAQLLGRKPDAKRYAALADRIAESFNRSFLDRNTGWYADSSQTAQALPLYLGMVPEDMVDGVEARLLDAIAWNDGHTNVGFVGVQPLLKYLSEHGHFRTAFELVTRRESPGWLHMLKNGKNSTLGENLNAEGYGTGHHPFGTCVGHWLFQYVGGIQIGQRAGWQAFRINPGMDSEVSRASVELNTSYGKISSSWRRQNEKVEWSIAVPWNTNADVLLGTAGDRPIFLNGKPLAPKRLQQSNDGRVLNLKSGTYQITW